MCPLDTAAAKARMPPARRAPGGTRRLLQQCLKGDAVRRWALDSPPVLLGRGLEACAPQTHVRAALPAAAKAIRGIPAKRAGSAGQRADPHTAPRALETRGGGALHPPSLLRIRPRPTMCQGAGPSSSEFHQAISIIIVIIKFRTTPRICPPCHLGCLHAPCPRTAATHPPAYMQQAVPSTTTTRTPASVAAPQPPR